MSEDDSILLRYVDDAVDTSPDKCHLHRATGEMANPRNQHIEMPQIEYTDKVADESVAVQRQVSPRTTETKAPEHQWPAMTNQVETQTRTSKAKPLPNTAGQREECGKHLPRS